MTSRFELGTGAGSKNWNYDGTGHRKKFDDIFSHLDTIQLAPPPHDMCYQSNLVVLRQMVYA